MNKVNVSGLVKFFHDNPNGTYTILPRELKNMSSRSFSLYKKKFKDGTLTTTPIRRKTKLADPVGLLSFFKENPGASYKDCLAKGHSVSLSTFTRYRKKALAGMSISDVESSGSKRTKKNRTRKNLYMTVWMSQPDMSKEAKATLTSFIEELNSSERACFEIIERTNPNIIEIREITKQGI